MSKQNLEYQEEHFYSMIRMSVLLILTFLSFFISSDIIPKIQLVQLILGALMIVSLAYHALITYMPDHFVSIRKYILLLLDFAILTFFISLIGKNGAYLLPLYAIIVTQYSVSYGLSYYLGSALFATVSLAYLASSSPYWKEQNEVIIAFGIITLLVPLFYMRTLFRMDKIMAEAEEKITYVEELEEKAGTELTGVEDRDSYKAHLNELVKQKEIFTLLFISIQQRIEGEVVEPMNDILLQSVVDEIKNVLDEDDFFARLSSHEFAIITKRSRAFLRNYLQKLENVIISPHKINGKTLHLEPNIGVALFPEDGRNEMTIGKCADEAMNAAKEKENVHHLFYRRITS